MYICSLRMSAIVLHLQRTASPVTATGVTDHFALGPYHYPCRNTTVLFTCFCKPNFSAFCWFTHVLSHQFHFILPSGHQRLLVAVWEYRIRINTSRAECCPDFAFIIAVVDGACFTIGNGEMPVCQAIHFSFSESEQRAHVGTLMPRFKALNL